MERIFWFPDVPVHAFGSSLPPPEKTDSFLSAANSQAAEASGGRGQLSFLTSQQRVSPTPAWPDKLWVSLLRLRTLLLPWSSPGLSPRHPPLLPLLTRLLPSTLRARVPDGAAPARSPGSGRLTQPLKPHLCLDASPTPPAQYVHGSGSPPRNPVLPQWPPLQ